MTTPPCARKAPPDNQRFLEKQVEATLASMDPQLTREYHRALEIIPDLVRRESKITDFLRIEHNDPTLAAQRLARYWKIRESVYGQRWLLPMTQNGCGALAPEYVRILRTGFLKQAHSDKLGRVSVFDFSLLPEGASQIQPAVIFYICSVYPGETTLLFVVRAHGKHTMAMSDWNQQILNATPVRIKAMYVVQAYEEGREHLLEFLGYQQRRVAEMNLKQQLAGYIAAPSSTATLQELVQKGFDLSCIPCEMGGALTKRKFDNWIRTRLSTEEILGVAPIMRNHLGGAVFSSQAVTDTNPVVQSLVVKQKGIKRGREYPSIIQRPDETDQAFQRRKNACYVRRNYHRQKLEFLAIQGEAARCKDLNTALKTENLRLERLVLEAMVALQQAMFQTQSAASHGNDV